MITKILKDESKPVERVENPLFTCERMLLSSAILARTIMLVAVAILICIPTAIAQSADARAQRSFDQGSALYEKDDAESLNLALGKFGEAFDLYSRSQNKVYMALSRVFLGKTWKKLGDPEKALVNYADAAKLYSEVGDKNGEAAMYNNVAAIFRDYGQQDEAIKYYQLALQLYDRKSSAIDQARTYSGLADSYRFSGAFREAVSNYQKSLDIWRSLKNNDDKIRAHYGIALAYFALGDPQNSVTYGNQALQLARQMNEPGVVVEVLESLAVVYDNDGQKKVAVDYRLQALREYERARGRVSENAWDLVVNNLADLYYRMGDLDSAYKYASGNIRVGVNGKDYPSQSYMVGTLGEILTAQGKYDEAIVVLNRANQLARQADDKHSEAYNYASLGVALLGTSLSDPLALETAKEAFQKALSYFKPGESPPVEGKARAGLIFTYARMGKKDLAAREVANAEASKLDSGDGVPAIQVLRAIGLANAIFEQHNYAIRYFEKAVLLAEKRNNVIEGVALLSDLGYSNLNSGNYAKAKVYYQRSADATKVSGNKELEANSLVQLAWSCLYSGDPDQALLNAEKAVAVAVKTESINFRMYIGSSAFHVAGKAHFRKQEYENSITAISEALKIAEKTNDKPMQKHYLTDLSEIYEAMGNKKLANQYSKKAKKID